MNFQRENVIWQSPKDDCWYRGFFVSYSVGDEMSDDYDPEWDVEYDYDIFSQVCGPYSSEDEADRGWWGPNPGGYDLSVSEEASAIYDRMLRAYVAANPKGLKS